MNILNFGSLNIDYVYRVDTFLEAGETKLSKDLNLFCGGKGLNQSIAMARAGNTVYHAGLLGEDGQMLKDKLMDNGVKLDYLKPVPGKSGHADNIDGYHAFMKKFEKNIVNSFIVGPEGLPLEDFFRLNIPSLFRTSLK